MSLVSPHGDDPENCEEFGYGIGTLGGIMIFRYAAGRRLEFGRSRQDFLHQVYWSPDGLLTATHGNQTGFVGTGQAVWVRRAVGHTVSATSSSEFGRQTVYRICLREIPPALFGLRIGTIAVPSEAATAILALTAPGLAETEALSIRANLFDALDSNQPGEPARASTGRGPALQVARRLAQDPGDPTDLSAWAAQVHVSSKTLQRDFIREFGTSFTAWRTDLRLRAAQVLLDTHPVSEVAHLVGYSSSSAFIAAFRRTHGRTPGRRTA
ncbi:AraC family transcriptional regulator [Kribbella sp. NBC_01505]|uniref:helix-turn-helix domain-containing protein n=1 Tax=Kribbella sp. NBC_01505 TaxID=2903580 RepID=UPI00386C679A